MKIPDKILVVTVTDDRDYPNHFWENPLKKNCKNLIWLDLQKAYFNYGSKSAFTKILDLIKKEKPDYLFMFDSLYYDLDLPCLLTNLKKISPQTKSVLFSGDDDLKFNSIRYLGLFFDYLLVAQNDFLNFYKRDGLKNTFFVVQTKSYNFEKDEKIYDVSFIGTPKSDRNEIMEYLLRNNINLVLFGHNWNNYSALKKAYMGVIPSKDYLKTLSQTKINLCLSKNMLGIPHMKGRFLEICECNAFSLVEYSPHLKKLFKERKEIIFFRNKTELLKKIRYYLKNEKEREKISNAAYKRLKKDYSFEQKIGDFVKINLNNPTKKNLPKIDYSIINLDEERMFLSKQKLFKLIENYGYISFSKGKIKKSQFKEYLQVYSLIKNKKEISICDYFVYSKILGNYVQFRYCPFGIIPNKNYNKFLNINQLIVSKKFFIENTDLLLEAYKKEDLSFVNRFNTCFVSVPLVSINKFKKGFFKDSEFNNELGLFLFSFHRELYSRRKNPVKFIFYFLSLLKESLSGKKFIYSQLLKKFKEKKGIKIK